MKTKTFDRVEMKRRGAAKVREKLRGMTEEEQIAFWRKATLDLRKLKERLHRGREGPRKRSGARRKGSR
jgi:hypothetical protein